VIEACDHVVTVSNTTAHLAGALNKKTFMLLAKNDGSIWYWQNQKNNKSLWYPSIEIFQQTAENEWTGPVLEIENKINA
jgi:ADP-heptose:LPS heptosyltransferase